MSQPVKYSELWDRLQPHALKSINGMQNNKKSTKGGQNPYVILLYKASSQVVSPYSVTNEGLQAAAAASADGDGIWLPACSISGAHTLPAGVTLIGMGAESSVLTGMVTLGAGAMLIGVGVVLSVSDANIHYGVVGPASGTAYLQGCKISVTQAGAGTGYAVRTMDGAVESAGCELFGTTAAVVWGGTGQFKSNHDRITATIPFITGQSSGAYTFDSTYQGWAKVPSEWNPHTNHVLSIDTVTFHGTPGAIKITSTGMGNLDYAYTGPLTLYKDMTLTVHTNDVISMWVKCNSIYRGERVYIKVVYTDGDTLIYDNDADGSFDWTQYSLTVPAEDDGKIIQRVYFGEYLDGWDNVFDSTWWFDDVSIVSVVTEYDPNVVVNGSKFESYPSGVPSWSDRSVWDASLYPERHANDLDVSADSLHHTLGVTGEQAAAGDHQTHAVEELTNVVSTSPAIGDILKQTDWKELEGGAESLYDSALLTVAANGGTVANAFDESYANYWRADPPPNWATVEFPYRVFLSKIIIDQTVMGWPLNGVTACAVYGSDTGAFGGEETLIINDTDLPGTRKTITMPTPRTGYRYYKLDFGSSPTNVDITEIEMYTMEAEPVWENVQISIPHDAVTVSDTATVDLTLAGQALSAAVIPGGIKLDDLGAPDDNTDLDASTAKHGLMKKFPGGTTDFLREDGTFVAPPGGSITVEEVDGAPSVANVNKIKVTNGTLTDNGAGVVTMDFGSAATDGAAIHDNVAGEIAAITEKTTPVGADKIIIEDSEDSNAKKMVQIDNLPTGGAASPYLLDTPPGSPHAKDDDFSGSSLDAKWTNPATSTRTLTLSVANGMVIFEPSETGTASTGKRGGFGIRQAAPTGSFTIMAKIYNTGHVGDEARVGIFVARTADSKGHILGNLRDFPRIVNANGFTYSESADWGAYDGFDSFIAPDWPIVVWTKIVWNSSAGSLAFYFSADGMFWTLLTTRTGQSQPDRIGIAIWANTANIFADHVLACDWFRVTEP